MEVVKLLTNPTIASFAASAILLAIISTASSLLSAASSNIAQDFVNKETQGRLPLVWTKVITLATGVIALIGSYTATNILSCMVASYEVSVACLFVPLVMAVIYKERCKTLFPAALLAVVCGATGFVITKCYHFGMLNELIPLGCSAVGYATGALLVKREENLRFEI